MSARFTLILAEEFGGTDCCGHRKVPALQSSPRLGGLHHSYQRVRRIAARRREDDEPGSVRRGKPQATRPLFLLGKNRRPLRPELRAQANEVAASRRYRWPHAVPDCRAPRLTASGGASLLPFCSRRARRLAGSGLTRCGRQHGSGSLPGISSSSPFWRGRAQARGALDRRVAAAPDYDHPVDAAGVVRLLRLGVRRGWPW